MSLQSEIPSSSVSIRSSQVSSSSGIPSSSISLFERRITSSELIQASLVIVHIKATDLFIGRETLDLGSDKSAISVPAYPLSIDHFPLPTIGVFASKVKFVSFNLICSEPAMAVVAGSLTLTVKLSVSTVLLHPRAVTV